MQAKQKIEYSVNLPVPLFWQIYLFFWLAGLYASVYFLASLICLSCLIFLDQRLRPINLQNCLRLVFCFALMFLGWQVASSQLKNPAMPDYFAEALESNSRPKATTFCGQVKEVTGIVDGRLRILLASVKAEANEFSLPNFLAWTWQDATFTPRIGQEICLTRPILPARSFANTSPNFQYNLEDRQFIPLNLLSLAYQPQILDSGIDLWRHSKAISYLVWSKGKQGNPYLKKDLPEMTKREQYREIFLKLLLAEATTENITQENITKSESNLESNSEVNLANWRARHQAEAMLPALLFGDRQYVEHKTFNLIAKASLAHSLALSGQHLATAAIAGYFMVFCFIQIAYPKLFMMRPRQLWILLASLPFAYLYIWISDSPLSLIRAGSMLALVCLAMWLDRSLPLTNLFVKKLPLPRLTWDALCLAVLLITLNAPLSVFDLGLQLSVLCLATLCCLPPILAKLPLHFHPVAVKFNWHIPYTEKIIRNLANIFIASLSIQIVMLPISILTFNNLGHWFWLNVFWLPVLGIITMPFAFLSLILAILELPLLATFCIKIAALPCQGLLILLNWLDSYQLLDPPTVIFPHWLHIPAIILLFVAFALVFTQKKAQTCLQIAILGFILLLIPACLRGFTAWQAKSEQSIVLEALDVGQGQSLLLKVANNRFLFDGGGGGSARFDFGKSLLLPYIAQNSVPELQAIFNTHPDMDHAGGLLFLLEHCKIANLFDNGQEASGLFAQRWQEIRDKVQKTKGGTALAKGDLVQLAGADLGVNLEIYAPDHNLQSKKANDASLIMRLTKNGKGLVFIPGDSEKLALRHLIKSDLDLTAEVLILPHHGSASSYMPALYRAVKPKIVIACCGYANRYAYPSKKVEQWFANADIPLLDTGRLGKIQIMWQKDRKDFTINTSLARAK